MAKRLVYIPITLLFIFSAAALISHYMNIGDVQAHLMRSARLPFGYMNGRVSVIPTPEAAPGVRLPDHTGFVQTVALAEGAACVEHDSRAACDGRRLCCGMACSASALIVAGGFPEAPTADLAAAGVPRKSDAQVSASQLYRPPNA